MNRKSPVYIIVYTVLVATCFAVILVLVSQVTRSAIELNQQTAEMRAILGALNLPEVFADLGVERIEEAERESVQTVFAKYVNPPEIPKPKLGVRPYTIYEAVKDGTLGYAFPANGQGFWGPIYGYLAVEPDLVTVRGVYFYRDEETPGLGHEIREEWFRDAWPGKRYWPSETATKVGRQLAASAPGAAGETIQAATPAIEFRFTPRRAGSRKDYNELDAITGASETTRAVSRFICDSIQRFLIEMAEQRNLYPAGPQAARASGVPVGKNNRQYEKTAPAAESTRAPVRQLRGPACPGTGRDEIGYGG